MRLTNSVWRVATLSILLWALTAAGQVTATVPYSVSVFATSVTGVYTQPDSIAVLGGHVFVGYGNNVSTTGSDGKSSTIVEYAMNGNVIKTYSVLGHNDGLRVNPQSKQLWALQNEDANPNLVIIDPGTGHKAPRTHLVLHLTAAAMTICLSAMATCSSAHPIPPTIPTPVRLS